MAKKQSGPSLSQREKKKQAAESAKLAALQAEEEASQSEQQAINDDNNTLPEREPFPQERALAWLAQFCHDYFTTDKFLQISLLAFCVNQAYVTFDETYTANEDVNLLISTLAGIVALVAGTGVAYKVKANLSSSHGVEIPLPPWNTIYLVFIPVMLSYIYNRDLLLYNSALISNILELPWYAKIIVEVSILNSNSSHADPVFNMKVVLMNLVISYALTWISEGKSLDKVEVSLFSVLISDLYIVKTQELYILILQKLFISFAAGAVLICAINLCWRSNTIFRSLFILVSWSSLFVYATIYQLNDVLGQNALIWLYEYVTLTETRQKILLTWLGSLLLLIPTIFNYKIQLSPNFRRKIWHFLVLILLAYPLYIDPEFVKLCLSGSLILFLIVEMIRYLKLEPFGIFLDNHLREFADFRDEKGPIIISYIYLFIGITIPILINGSAIGLVVLGVGDSLASIVGSNYGLINWPHSNKTVEGTTTFIFSTFLVSAFFKYLGWFFLDNTYSSLFLTCTLSGLLEGNSNMNDNIMIPGYMAVFLPSLQ